MTAKTLAQLQRYRDLSATGMLIWGIPTLQITSWPSLSSENRSPLCRSSLMLRTSSYWPKRNRLLNLPIFVHPIVLAKAYCFAPLAYWPASTLEVAEFVGCKFAQELGLLKFSLEDSTNCRRILFDRLQS